MKWYFFASDEQQIFRNTHPGYSIPYDMPFLLFDRTLKTLRNTVFILLNWRLFKNFFWKYKMQNRASDAIILSRDLILIILINLQKMEVKYLWLGFFIFHVYFRCQ